MANPIMEFFKYDHLSAAAQVHSKPFCDLAAMIENEYPDCPEKTAGLRKLLEAKDCIVRTAISKVVKK